MIRNKFFRKLTDGNDSLFQSLNIRNGNLVICREIENNTDKPYKNFAAFDSHLSYFFYSITTPSNRRSDYEIIKGDVSQKIYADIDIELVDDPLDSNFSHSKEEKYQISNTITEAYIESLIKIVPSIKKSDIMVFNSHSNKKRSFHIIVDRWYVQSASHNKELFKNIMENIPLEYRKYFDYTMYKSIQYFRIFLSTKCGKNRYKMLDNEKSTWNSDWNFNNPAEFIKEIFLSSLITYTCSCFLIPIEIKEMTNNVVSREIDEKTYSHIIKAFNNFPDRNAFEILKERDTCILLLRRRPTYCSVCQRTHENENPFLFVGPSGRIYFNCRRGNGSLEIGNINENTEFFKKPDMILQEGKKIEVSDGKERMLEKITCVNVPIKPFIEGHLRSNEMENFNCNSNCQNYSNFSNYPSSSDYSNSPNSINHYNFPNSSNSSNHYNFPNFPNSHISSNHSISHINKNENLNFKISKHKNENFPKKPSMYKERIENATKKFPTISRLLCDINNDPKF